MSSGDRKPYLSATSLSQEVLDSSHDNLINQIEMVAEIELPTLDLIGVNYVAVADLGGATVTITDADHGLKKGNTITNSNASSANLNGSFILVSTTKNTFSFNVNAMPSPAIGTIDIVATRTIYASDRNKYVGGVFYEALLNFKVIKRSLGEFLSPTLEFSTISLILNNADARFSAFLPGGSKYGGWIQKRVDLKIGLRDVENSYATIFKGRITEVGGTQRSTSSVTIIARDNFEKMTVDFPPNILSETEFPDIEINKIGKTKPVIYGDWTTNLNEDSNASIPCIAVNGVNAGVLAFTSNPQFFISDNDNFAFDSSSVVIERSSKYWPVNSSDIVNVSAGNNFFEIQQSGSGGTTLVDGNAYEFKTGDKIWCQLEGKNLGAYDANIVEQARDILKTYGNVDVSEFDSSWNTYRDKAAPAESAVSTFKSRVYKDKPASTITYALSLLEQVRLEAFVARDLKIKITSYHFDDFVAIPSHTVRNWDVERGTFKPKTDVRNNINRTQGFYNLLPDIGEEAYATPYYRNQPAIDLIEGKVIGKGITFPNLYELDTVIFQTKEILKITSSYFETIEVNLTWRSILLDLGDFIAIDVKIGSVEFSRVPAQIRTIGYDSNGIKIPVKVWSHQLMPFSGYNPGFSGTVGGYNATITEE